MGKVRIILFAGFLFFVHQLQAQFNPYSGGEAAQRRRSGLRVFLNKFSLGLSSGYGHTFYKHSLDEFSLVKSSSSINIIPASGSSYSNWLNNPQSGSGASGTTYTSADGKLGYKGAGRSIPLMLTIHYNFSRFRIGGGIEGEYHWIKQLEPLSLKNELGNYIPDKKSTLFFRYFGMAGVKVYDYWGYSYVIDLQVGKANYGKAFNKSLIDKGIFFNVGVSVEKNLSEYFRIVARPSFDFKNYTMNLPGGESSVKHKQNAAYLHIGISYTFPEIPKCRVRGCKVNMKHIHQGFEFRGSPVYKKQNPRIGELEKQPLKIRLKKKHTEDKKEKK